MKVSFYFICLKDNCGRQHISTTNQKDIDRLAKITEESCIDRKTEIIDGTEQTVYVFDSTFAELEGLGPDKLTDI